MRMSESRATWHLAGTGAVASLEAKLSRWYAVPRALAVANATSGLLGIGLALDLRGAEFVTTPYTWGGSVASWVMLGCRPVFADIDRRTLTLDPSSVAERITPHTRAILAVDIDGTPSNSRALREIADEHGLWYIADCAQSLGATRGGSPASREADALVVSFTSGKTIDVGEGGAVVTPHSWLYERLIWYSQHPQRQARELGLGLVNELSINARIHPSAARDADATFERALAGVASRQDTSFAILRVLERSRLIEKADLPGADACCPSFYRLSVTAKDGTSEKQLQAQLSQAGFRVCVEPSPVGLLYRRGIAPLKSSLPCPNAEDLALRRFVIRDNA